MEVSWGVSFRLGLSLPWGSWVNQFGFRELFMYLSTLAIGHKLYWGVTYIFKSAVVAMLTYCIFWCLTLWWYKSETCHLIAYSSGMWNQYCSRPFTWNLTLSELMVKPLVGAKPSAISMPASGNIQYCGLGYCEFGICRCWHLNIVLVLFILYAIHHCIIFAQTCCFSVF